MGSLIYHSAIDRRSEWFGQEGQQGDRVGTRLSCLRAAQNDVRPPSDELGHNLFSVLWLDTSVSQHGWTTLLRFELIEPWASIHEIGKREWAPVVRSMRVEVDDERCVDRSCGTEWGDHAQHDIKW